jgi:hypothetical protein
VGGCPGLAQIGWENRRESRGEIQSPLEQGASGMDQKNSLRPALDEKEGCVYSLIATCLLVAAPLLPERRNTPSAQKEHP